jgi:hypothetical protein
VTYDLSGKCGATVPSGAWGDRFDIRRCAGINVSPNEGSGDRDDRHSYTQACIRQNSLSSADSNAYVATVAEGSGSVGCEFHDEVGVKGGADPFQQRNRGHYAARFKP